MVPTLPGDLIPTVTDPDSFLDRAIQRISDLHLDWTPSHVAVVAVGGPDPATTRLIEAVFPRVAGPHSDPPPTLAKYAGAPSCQWLLQRHLDLTMAQRQAVVDWCLRYEGRPYDVFKLGLELLDGITGSTKWARMFGVESMPICSVLAASGYKHGASLRYVNPATGGDLPINATTPAHTYAQVFLPGSPWTILAGRL